ncbi:amino acid adenylation domain-containing protein [Marininema mesophilum]|uniref:Amino acid adenylation domain-containing protein n=1 Tax=Marininema mesophilum TaxID=1048340 RepID=A0A1H2YU69_9BACL|nr:non-ribosomal peptide synthetase [Marininema mesophilum]SDX08713.1 amino acid adenylation domain-containing protein [Marininema mesophilum]
MSYLFNNLQKKVKNISILTDEEYRQILLEWNDTAVEYPSGKGLHHLIEEQVLRTSANIAVTFKDEQINYDQLNGRSNQLAHYLREMGVKKDTVVGVLMERSVDLVVTLLGILKAGGAYLPLDVESPSARLGNILEDAQAPICITQPHLENKLSDVNRVQPFVLEKQRDLLQSFSQENLDIDFDPDQSISIYYTSGSTGKPKGVVSTHRGWVNRMCWMQREHRLTAEETVLQKTTLTFDDAAVEFFWPLMVGAKIALMEPGLHRDPRAILDTAIQYQVAVIQFVPSMLRMILNAITQEDKERLSTVRVVVSSGEALPASLVGSFLDKMPGDLFNSWGATEVSIDSTVHKCTEEDVLLGGIISVGRPFDNNHVYILDSLLRPVPVGVAGDLFLGGVGLAREYLNQPDKTNEAFISNPFVPGTRMYKTGDRGFYRPDGSIMFLGRKDNQIKIRGMRVELGEIESVLRNYIGIKDVIVEVSGKGDQIKRLIAYVVSHGVEVSQRELQSYLRSQLPDYMVPSYYMFLEEMPLNANGKIDRGALPQPNEAQIVSDSEFVEARTDTEKAIAEIFNQILGLSRIGIHDNFFSLGGHSLLAIKLVSRIQETFGVRIPLRTVFESPTVEKLSSTLDRDVNVKGHIKKIMLSDRTQPIPLSYAQQRLWFLNQLDPENTAYNMPMIINLKGRLNKVALNQSLQHIIERHESLRTSIQNTDDGPVQVINPSCMMELPLIDFTSYAGDQRIDRAKEWYHDEARRPFDLSQAPLIRAYLLRLDLEEHALVINIHHIFSDGWSLDILKQELTQCYEAFVKNSEPSFPDLTYQYADYAYSQQQWMKNDDFQTQLAYWKKRLDGDIPVLSLPKDQVPEPTSKLYTHKLPIQLTDQLKKWSEKQGATLFMTMLAGFKVLLHRLTGQEDILVGTPVINRDNQHLESLIGMFLNTVVMRTQLSSKMSFKKIVHQVRNHVINDFSHQDIPFETIVEEIQPNRSLSRSPLFDVFVNYVNFENTKNPTWNLPDLRVEPLEWLEPESKFLLTLYIVETDQELVLNLVHQPDAFSTQRIEVWLEQYQLLLEQMMEESDEPIYGYSLVGKNTDGLLPDPTIELDRPKVEKVYHQIIDHAQQQPQKVAIQQGVQYYTYSQLVEEANKVAELLRTRGVQPKQVIAVRGKRGHSLIPIMLGIWQVDGVLLLVDSMLPASRQQLFIEEATASWLIDIPKDLQSVNSKRNLVIHSLENKKSVRINEFADQMDGDPAYIFFTSGTTGKPKGVLGSHQGLSHFLMWQQKEFDIHSGDRAAQLTNLSFDVYLRDTLLVLISGGTLCIPEDPYDLNGETIFSWVEREKISLIHTVPSILQSWVIDQRSDSSLASLRWIFIAGEPLTGALVEKWRSKFKEAGSLVNLYGPTETSLAKCFYIVPESPPQGILSIGQPIPQTQILILNENRNLCGVGEVGEIVIRTPFRSLGYHNSPDETKRVFRLNHFRKDTNDSLYYTGDIGRYRFDGTLEILGRTDDVVKIRGVKVQPNEIAAVISKHPAVNQCVVIPYKDQAGEYKLCAYIVPLSSDAIKDEELRAYIAQELPVSMQPSGYMFLPRLPLTPNGKVDRKALPDPVIDMPKTVYVPPNDEVEKQICEIWSSLLKVEEVGITDNFFSLGGHSLIAVQVVARIRKSFAVDLPVAHLFEFPTVEKLAELVRNRQNSSLFVEPISAIEPQLKSESIDNLSNEEIEAMLQGMLNQDSLK